MKRGRVSRAIVFLVGAAFVAYGVYARTNVKNEAAKSLCTVVGLKQATNVVFHSSIKPA